MNEHDINQVLKRIRSVIYHVGTFEGSYPRVLKNAPVYTRSHLIVFYEILPDLIRLLEFSSETIPVISKILGLATEGKSDLEKASEYLRTINQSSETAVTEIFASLDQVGASLQKAQKAESADEEQKETLKQANMQLMGIMNALQFQDITSQKIEATTALLANLGDGLVELIKELGVKVENHTITVRQGTYDPNAAFDRESAGEKQGEIDDLVASEVSRPPKEQLPSEQKDIKTKDATPTQQAEEAPGNDVVADVDDIDALVASAQSDEGETEINDNDVVTDVDDIDALVASAQSDEGETEINDNDVVTDVDDIDALVASAQNEDNEKSNDQGDIDALVASAQNGSSDPSETEVNNEASDAPINQDDIDALLDQ